MLQYELPFFRALTCTSALLLLDGTYLRWRGTVVSPSFAYAVVMLVCVYMAVTEHVTGLRFALCLFSVHLLWYVVFFATQQPAKNVRVLVVLAAVQTLRTGWYLSKEMMPMFYIRGLCLFLLTGGGHTL